MFNFGEFLKTWILRSNSVTRQVTFEMTKIGGKCQSWKIQMGHFDFSVISKNCVLFFYFSNSFCGQSKSYVAWIDYLDFLICFQGGEWHENISWCLGMFEYFYLCLDLKNPFDITLIWIHGEFSQTTDWFFPAAGPASYILLGQNCLQSYRAVVIIIQNCT